MCGKIIHSWSNAKDDTGVKTITKKAYLQFNKYKVVICLILASVSNYFLAVCGVSYFAVLLIDVLFILFANLQFKLPDHYLKFIIPLCIVIMSGACFVMGQNELYADMSNIAPNGFFLNLFICGFVITLCIYLTGKAFVGIATGTILLMLLSTVDYLVYSFRGSEFTPYDILAIGTAVNVAAEYEFPVSINFVVSSTVIALLLVLISDFRFNRIDRKNTIKVFAPVLSVLLAGIIILSNTMVSYRWDNGGAIYRGVYANFLLEVQESRVKKPSGYNVTELEGLVSKYSTMTTVSEDLPNIIVIMNESFADLQELGSHFDTNNPVMPFIDSLKENTIKGYAYSSVFGGGTSSSEFEFLTGNTMAFLPSGSIPYQQFVREDTHSMVSDLKNLGYTCQAYHPYYSSGWNREKVYPAMGFDESFFLDHFPEKKLIRGLVSDEEMYKTMLKDLKGASKNSPIFMFGVTMQNHGGYTDDNYSSFITIEGHEGEFPEAEQYLSLINQSDSAFEYLIERLKKIDKRTIVVFFGDHLPSLPSEFYEFACNDSSKEDVLNDDIEKNKVPFIIWANYDIEAYTVDKTSINFLASYVYEAAGIRTPFSSILKDISETVPAINSRGYYSMSDSSYKDINDAEKEERESIDFYRKIQYNNMFDKKHRLSIFN